MKKMALWIRDHHGCRKLRRSVLFLFFLFPVWVKSVSCSDPLGEDIAAVTKPGQSDWAPVNPSPSTKKLVRGPLDCTYWSLAHDDRTLHVAADTFCMEGMLDYIKSSVFMLPVQRSHPAPRYFFFFFFSDPHKIRVAEIAYVCYHIACLRYAGSAQHVSNQIVGQSIMLLFWVYAFTGFSRNRIMHAPKQWPFSEK